ncbi:MAG: endonuclease III [Candidatus Omnitrophica bacterium]|nr:endonuclease III [Candidatus Omnitrophota bacterium]
MPISNHNISSVIHILRREVKRFSETTLTLVGKKYKSPYLILISCLLSLRTKDETTLPASERLFALADTPEAMLRLSERQIVKIIYPVGFYHVKAKNILAISRQILGEFDGRVPNDLDRLLTLPGVGRKTANLVLTEGFGLPGICVDTHVHRISNRWGYVRTKSPLETETALRQKLPRRFWLEINELLVLWGQNICRPISPHCSICNLRPYCARTGVTASR